MSDLTAALPELLPSKEVGGRLLPSVRSLKIVLSATVALLGAYGVLLERQYVSSTNAVVSSYVLDVRTPVEGTLRDVPATAGDMVPTGALLGRVDNDLTDHEHLDNLSLTEEAAQATAASLAQEHRSLEALRATLLSRAAVHSSAMSTRLAEEADAARLTLSAKQVSLRGADLDLERGRKLVGSGIISRSAYDKLQSAQEVLAAEVRSQQASYAALETEQTALHAGVLSEPGTNNDVAYSTQRADEVSLKLAENARDLSAAEAQAREAHLAVQAEHTRASLLDHSEVRAPSAGLVWKLNAVNGEHVAAGSPVLSLVDCNRQFILAEIPQDRTSAVLLNSKVDVKLTGEDAERTGTVMTVSGDGQQSLDVKLAAVPTRRLKEDLATVVIRLDPTPGQAVTPMPCLVGRTARVRIPTQPTNLLTLWISQRL